MDIVEHYIKNSSLKEIPTDFRHLVIEGKTTADKLENAICMAYNIKHEGWTNETGPDKASSAGWKWLSPKDKTEIDSEKANRDRLNFDNVFIVKS